MLFTLKLFDIIANSHTQTFWLNLVSTCEGVNMAEKYLTLIRDNPHNSLQGCIKVFHNGGRQLEYQKQLLRYIFVIVHYNNKAKV